MPILLDRRRESDVKWSMTVVVWSVVGLLAILSEFVVPEFVMFFVGIGALGTAGLVALVPGVGASIPLQLLSWIALTALSLMALRRRFKSAFSGTIFDRSTRESAATGKKAVVTEAIAPDTPGRVRFQGTTWRAVSYNEELAEGDHVEILKQDGMTLIVTKSILGAADEELQSGSPGSVDDMFSDR
ncbi:MAG: NfeD family protein [Spirochaetaceae bacterium]